MGSLKLSIFVVFCAIVAVFVWRMYRDNLPPIVEGYFQPEFMDVAQTLKQAMESGREQGAGFAVYHKGEVLVDMWAGYADRDAHRRWRNQTTTLTFDCTKGVVAFLMALLVDRGILNYDSPIADHWPEFAAHGKDAITLEQLLSHQAGLPYLSRSISLRELKSDADKVDKLLTKQKPVSDPGSRFEYHDLTQGLYLGSLVEKADPEGREIAEVFRDEIAKPYGIEYGLNLLAENFSSTARLRQHSWLQTLWQYVTTPRYLQILQSYVFNPKSKAYKAVSFFREYLEPVAVFNNPELREITQPSFSGTGTARGLAKLFSILAEGGVSTDGQRLLSKDAVTRLTTPVVDMLDPVSGQPAKYTAGLQVFQNPLNEPIYGNVGYGGQMAVADLNNYISMAYNEPIYGHAGYGGQMAVADLNNHISMAYVTSHLSIYKNGDDPRFLDVQKAVYKNLERYLARKRRMGL